jgi:hypothetical protein
MVNIEFVWTTEMLREFYRVVLYNYNCIDDIERETENFIKNKIISYNGKSRTVNDTIWQVRNLN